MIQKSSYEKLEEARLEISQAFDRIHKRRWEMIKQRWKRGWTKPVPDRDKEEWTALRKEYDTLHQRQLEILRENAKEMKQELRGIMKNRWFLTYPLLGNLPGRVQEMIEDITRYDSKDATLVSSLTNFIGYSLIVGTLTYLNLPKTDSLFDRAIWGYIKGVVIGTAVAFPEGMIRNYIRQNYGDSCGSLLGKMIGLPIEAALRFKDGLESKMHW